MKRNRPCCYGDTLGLGTFFKLVYFIHGAKRRKKKMKETNMSTVRACVLVLVMYWLGRVSPTPSLLDSPLLFSTTPMRESYRYTHFWVKKTSLHPPITNPPKKIDRGRHVCIGEELSITSHWSLCCVHVEGGKYIGACAEYMKGRRRRKKRLKGDRIGWKCIQPDQSDQ